MNAPSLRSRSPRHGRALRRAEEIVDAAAHVFAERGYHGTSTQAIADTLGMRQASLYYYFPSKEAALERVCVRGVDGFVERAEAIVADDGTPCDKLLRLIAAHLAPNTAKRDYVKVFINERRYLPEPSRRRVGRMSRRIEKCFEQVVRAGIADGSLRADIDARLVVLAVLGMCNAVINWAPGDQARDVRAIAAELGKLTVQGLMAGESRGAGNRT